MLDATIRDLICTLTHSDLRTARFLLQRYIELEKLVATCAADDQRRCAIQYTLELAKTALQRLGSGFKYKRDDPDDPVQQALDAVDQYLPQSSSTRQRLPDDRGRIESLAAAIDTLKQANDSILTEDSLPIRVTVYSPDSNSSGLTTSISSYISPRESSYTIDDLLFVIRLRDPASLPNYPFIYSRLFNAHAHTHDGSKFEQIRGSRALTTLSRIGNTATVAVHLVSMNVKFVLLVRGVPVQHSGEDELHVISRVYEPITATLQDHREQTRAFHHHSEAWKYKYGPGQDSEVTWSYLQKINRLKMYQSEWIVCVSGA